MRRFILTTTTALSIMMSGTTGMCYAKDSGFGDVTGAVLYCEDIQRLNDMGVLSGYGDGNFYLDNKISVAEGITIAEKAFGGEDTLPDKWEDWFSPCCGWEDNIRIDKYLFRGDYSKNMSYETAAEVVLKLNDLKIIDAALWGKRNTSYNAYLNTLYIRGYEGTNKEVPYSPGAITRGEYCHMIAYMLDYDGTYTIQPKEQINISTSVYMPEQLTDSNAYALCAKSLMLNVPESIRIAFESDGFEVVIVPYSEWLALFPDDGKYTGFYFHSDKKVYIRSDHVESIVHEFGHYLHNKLQETGYDISTEDEFKRQLGLFRYNRYFMTNNEEFFAEAFDVYCTYPDQLKDRALEVYEFIDNAVKTFEGLTK